MTKIPSRKPRSLIGVALMLAAMTILPFLDVVAKTLGNQNMPIIQIVWARMAFGAALTLPFVLRLGGVRALWPDRPWYHTLRAALLISATFSFFFALKFLPIADALAIFFVQPLVVTALSPLVLRERVGPRRWTAVAIGFLGTLIIIRPGFAEVNPGTFLALAAGTSLALYFLMTRRIAGQTHAVITTFHTSLIGTALTTAVALFFWQAPSPPQWGLLLLIGLIATVGHFLIVRAYDHAEASLLAPLAYTEIVMATLAGWWFFGDFPDGWTFLGVAILIACAIYISLREGARKPPLTPEAA
ncbi:DMT family transporter [Paragemmobacter straminiformis]|uniref:DMT family transporter n=1 Tax=Paragemmobacter straminiformis TaxID=2045119 RepID=A0A842I6P8_9RHOB|nr:DMT family transporter [Gemmobacter straminiformis]MBC2834744.1 DMT family transporter [Gemmobacter straminiformis]